MSVVEFKPQHGEALIARCKSCLRGAPCEDSAIAARGSFLGGTGIIPETDSPQVAVCSEHAITRGALRALIQTASRYHVLETGGCASSFAHLASVGVEVMVVDFDLVDNSSKLIGRLRGLLEAAAGLPTLILSSEANAEACRIAYEWGARGLVLKQKGLSDLFDAIERIRQGDIWLEGTALQQILRQNGATKTAQLASDEIVTQLTAREREIVMAVAEGRSNREVGARLFIAEATVRHHLVKIFEKLNVSSRAQLIVFAYRHELVNSLSRRADLDHEQMNATPRR